MLYIGASVTQVQCKCFVMCMGRIDQLPVMKHYAYPVRGPCFIGDIPKVNTFKRVTSFVLSKQQYRAMLCNDTGHSSCIVNNNNRIHLPQSHPDLKGRCVF